MSLPAILAMLLVLVGTRVAFAEAPARVTPAPEAVAEPARRLFERGVVAARTGAWTESEKAFSDSARLVERPNTLFNWAIALIHLGRGREAHRVIERWLEVAATSATPAERQEIRELEQLANELSARLILQVEPVGARVALNGVPVPGSGARRSLVLDPGRYVIAVSAPGYTSRRIALELARGRSYESGVSLVFAGADEQAQSKAPSAPKPADAARTKRGALPYVLLAAGSGLIVGGAVTGFFALDADHEVTDACPSLQHCDRKLESSQRRARNLALATDVMLGLGVVGLGSAWVAFELAPGSTATSRNSGAQIAVGYGSFW